MQKRLDDIARSLDIPLSLVSARDVTTFKGGGEAYAFAPRTVDELTALCRALAEDGFSPFILGGGSNVIISDGICRSPIILTAGINNIKFFGDEVEAECGATLAALMREARERSLGGLEFLAGVPAAVGGAVKMNAGAYAMQIANRLSSARILGEDGREHVESPADFKYRQGARGVVLSARFELIPLPKEESARLASEYIAIRRSRQPSLPSCGSVFKNAALPAGKLIEECGLKGARKGGAMISEKHANFIVNVGGASADDFLYLADMAKTRVFDRFGVALENEFKILI